MRKAGKVINIEKNKVYIITTKNEFATLEKHATEPKIGEPYAGEEFRNAAIWKYLLVIACMAVLLFSIKKLYLDNKNNYSIIVDMNSSIKMEVTGTDKIKKVEGVSSGGYKIKRLLPLENKSLDEALKLILDESIKQKYLTKAHADDGFKISIFISGNKGNTTINLTEFIKYADAHNFKVLVNNNGQVKID
ncbi:MAG: anti-sigma-I factor RsgI family protein [Clostridium sp.]|uniref:anti-sigma-I factor RsgI family protein n=1 Tax=Clostridium sp. TaxID=1506 RepID=UPI003D6D59B4